MTYHR